MSDSHPQRPSEREDKRSFLQKVVEFIHPGPDSPGELIETLADAEDNDVIGADSRVMLEGVIRMADKTAGDVMVAAPRMDLLDINESNEVLLHQVITTAHSRFPVFDGERDNIIGVLLTKDLLKLQRSPGLSLRALLRPVTYVPESKPLNDLLRVFRSNRNHLAIVVDEFGAIAGLVTIEDVLEEIVGEIEDEFDVPEDEGDIFALADDTYRVAGRTPVERVEEFFEVPLQPEGSEEDFDTIGGLVVHHLGHVPRRGEHLDMAELRIEVLHVKGGAVHWFKVTRLGQA